MSIKWETIASRVTGLTIGPVGLSWTPAEDERKVIHSLVTALGDRRVLFDEGCGSDRPAMIASVSTIRHDITEALQRLGPSSHLVETVRQMRTTCHSFQNSLDKLNIDPNTGYGGPQEDLFIAIGRFRERVGERIALLCAKCELSLDDYFESVLPPQAV